MRALDPEAAVFVLQHLLHAPRRGKRVGPPGAEFADPVKVPLPGGAGGPQLADGEEVLFAVIPLLDVVDADGGPLVGEAVGQFALQFALQIALEIALEMVIEDPGDLSDDPPRLVGGGMMSGLRIASRPTSPPAS